MKTAAVGGGHGLAATLQAVRRYATDITAVVSVADDGGSTGRLRQAFDVPAPGDLRRCLVALAADAQSPWARAFGHRFDHGDVAGHALGNLVIAGLVAITGDFVAALDEAGRLLGAVGRVLPATTVPVVLRATTSSGGEVAGQVAIKGTPGIVRVRLDPVDAPAPGPAVDAIAEADQVVLGPGSLYTSVLAAAAVAGIREALARTRARRIYVCNLREEVETTGYTAADHVEALAAHGVQVDAVVCEPDAMPGGAQGLPGIDVVEAAVSGPSGRGHDPEALALVLAQLG